MPRVAALVVIFLAAAGCCTAHYTVLTDQQLAERGTRHYGKLTREDAVKASATALSTLGYQVTLAQPDTGVVKTAPKLVRTSATATSDTTATATEDDLAWTLNVEPEGDGVTIHATPRGFRNGSEMHQSNMWVAEVIDPKFQDLWSELDSTLAAGHAPAAPSASK